MVLEPGGHPERLERWPAQPNQHNGLGHTTFRYTSLGHTYSLK